MWQKATGLILKKLHTRDNDQLITVYTKELGKIIVFGRGAQKLTSRRLGALDTLNYVQLVIKEFGNGYSLKEISLKSSLQSLKQDFEKKKHLLLLAEVIDKLTAFNQQDEPLFKYLTAFLKRQAAETISDDDLFIQIVDLLKVMGYSLPPEILHSWVNLEKHIESLSQRSLKARQL
jgi:DNA repair protein RecO (recombination protein O)